MIYLFFISFFPLPYFLATGPAFLPSTRVWSAPVHITVCRYTQNFLSAKLSFNLSYFNLLSVTDSSESNLDKNATVTFFSPWKYLSYGPFTTMNISIIHHIKQYGVTFSFCILSTSNPKITISFGSWQHLPQVYCS